MSSAAERTRRISEARRLFAESGASQRRIARDVGLTPTTVNFYLKGQRHLAASTEARLLAVLADAAQKRRRQAVVSFVGEVVIRQFTNQQEA